MSLGTLSNIAGVGKSPSAPSFLDTISFAGDSSYPTGGSAAFQDKVRALVGDQREVLAVVPIECGGYLPQYDKVADKLKVYKSAGSAIALSEVANAADLSATTFKVLVISR